MNAEAARAFLDVSAAARPVELRQAYERKKAQLEESLQRAPTPSLQAKYRQQLAQLEAAFDLLARNGVGATTATPHENLPRVTKITEEAAPPAPAADRPRNEETSVPKTSDRQASPGNPMNAVVAALAAVVVLLVAAVLWLIISSRQPGETKAPPLPPAVANSVPEPRQTGDQRQAQEAADTDRQEAAMPQVRPKEYQRPDSTRTRAESTRRIGADESRRVVEAFVPTPSISSNAPLPAGPVRYTGNVGHLSATYDLSWSNNGTVSGTYFYPTRNPRTLYTLRGKNVADGVLTLEEYTNGVLTARISLTKRQDSGRILWEGEMHNTDGRSLPMTMTR